MTSTPTFNVSEVSKFGLGSTGYGLMSASDGTSLIVGAYGSSKAYIYGYDGTNWNEEAVFTKTSRFGYGVAIYGEWAVVSDFPVSTFQNGTATIYRKTAGVWAEHTVLTAPFMSVPGTTNGGNGFGSSVSLSGNTLIVGRPQNMTDTFGGVHVYDWDGTNWVQGQFLTVSGGTRVNPQYFGMSSSIDGGIMVVGGSGSTLPSSFGKGMAFISKRTGTTWSTPELIAPPTTDSDAYGWSTTVRGTKVLVGATYKNDTTGIPGRVFLYDVSGTTAVLEQTFTVKTDTSEIIQDTLVTTAANFGFDVGMSADGNVIAVGAINRNGVRGIVYVYENVGGVWGLSALPTNSWLTASDATTNARFGSSISFAQGGIVVGAYGVGKVYWFK